MVLTSIGGEINLSLQQPVAQLNFSLRDLFRQSPMWKSVGWPRCFGCLSSLKMCDLLSDTGEFLDNSHSWLQEETV